MWHRWGNHKFACCVGVSAKQFDVLLKVMKQQQLEQKPKLQPVPSPLEDLASITPQEVIGKAMHEELLCNDRDARLLWLCNQWCEHTL